MIFRILCTAISNKLVTLSEINLEKDENRSSNLLNLLDSSSNSNNVFLEEDEKISKCEARGGKQNIGESDYYTFLPSLQGKLKLEGDKIEFTNECFKSNVATLKEINSKQIVINIDSCDSINFYCRDTYLITTSNYHDIKTVVLHGEHLIILKNPSNDDLDEIKINGIKIFTICEGFIGTLKSLFYSLEMYVGGLGTNMNSWFPFMRPYVTEYMERSNLDMLKRYANINLEERENKNLLDINIEEEIKTGDFLAITRMDGLDPLIMLGTGAILGHQAIAV